MTSVWEQEGRPVTAFEWYELSQQGIEARAKATAGRAETTGCVMLQGATHDGVGDEAAKHEAWKRSFEADIEDEYVAEGTPIPPYEGDR